MAWTEPAGHLLKNLDHNRQDWRRGATDLAPSARLGCISSAPLQ